MIPALFDRAHTLTAWARDQAAACRLAARTWVGEHAIGAVRAWCRLRHGAAVTIAPSITSGPVWTARVALTITTPGGRAFLSGRILGDRLRDVLGAVLVVTGARDNVLRVTRFPRVHANLSSRPMRRTVRPDGSTGWTATDEVPHA